MEIFLTLDAGKELQASMQHAAGAASEALPPRSPLRRPQILEPPVRKYRNSAFVMGSEAKPRKLSNVLNFTPKLNGNLQFLEIGIDSVWFSFYLDFLLKCEF